MDIQPFFSGGTIEGPFNFWLITENMLPGTHRFLALIFWFPQHFIIFFGSSGFPKLFKTAFRFPQLKNTVFSISISISADYFKFSGYL